MTIRDLLTLTLLTIFFAYPLAIEAKESSYWINVQDLKQAQAPQIITATTDAPINACLTNGEYSVDIRQNSHKNSVFLTTSFVRIHASEAELIVQSSDNVCRIAVISGEAVISNTSERSTIKLGRGEAYESVALDALGSNADWTSSPCRLDKSSKLPIFRTARFATSLFALNPEPLEGQVVSSKKDYPKRASERAKIISPPTRCSYEAGCALKNELPIPAELVQHFPPSGWLPIANVAEPDNLLASDQNNTALK